jgi:hypothetical protein
MKTKEPYVKDIEIIDENYVWAVIVNNGKTHRVRVRRHPTFRKYKNETTS